MMALPPEAVAIPPLLATVRERPADQRDPPGVFTSIRLGRQAASLISSGRSTIRIGFAATPLTSM